MNIYKAKINSIILVILVFCLLIGCKTNVKEAGSYDIDKIKSYSLVEKIKNKPSVFFGKYYFDSESSKKPLEWLVLNLDTKNKRCILMSKYALEVNEISKYLVPGGTSFAINEISAMFTKIYGEIFSEEEKKKILVSCVHDKYKNIQKNSLHDHIGMNMFLLTNEEIMRYLPNPSDRICLVNDYIIGKYDLERSSNFKTYNCVNYWLMSKGRNENYYSFVHFNGAIVKTGASEDRTDIAVRPCIMIELTDNEVTEYKSMAFNIDKCECITYDECKKSDIKAQNYDYNIGDVFQFGNYYDFNKNEIGNKLTWKVIDRDEENHRLFILNEYPYYSREYNTNEIVNSWKDSSLRRWLNDDFYEKCFSEKEKGLISDTLVLNSDLINEYVDDKIYIFSKNEINKYLPSNSSKRTMRAEESITKDENDIYDKLATRSQIASISELMLYYAKISNCNYWVRDVINNGKSALNVDGLGRIDNVGCLVTDKMLQIRPCMYISYIDTETKNVYDDSDALYIKQGIYKVKFGSYKQNFDEEKTDIEWQVLYKDYNNKRALLMSEKALDLIPYSYYFSKDSKLIWENSNLRGWLNNSFYYEAFNENEQKKIITTNILGKIDSGGEYYGVSNKLYDNVFVLSEDEFNKIDDNLKICKGTEIIYNELVNLNEKVKVNECVQYWLRNVVGERIAYMALNNKKNNDYVVEKQQIYNTMTAVRPCIWVKYTDNDKYEKEQGKRIEKLDENTEEFNIYSFGEYKNLSEQYSNFSKSIEWVILENDIENKRVLMISREIIDYLDYEKEEYEKEYKKSKVYKWLNNDLINNIFSYEEKNRLLVGDENANVNLLTINQIYSYLYTNDLKKCKASDYALIKNNKKFQANNKEYVEWFSRDRYKGEGTNYNIVNSNGVVDYYVYIDMPNKYVIRPVIWVKYDE